LFIAALPLAAQSIWTGVYTTAQAARGKTAFETSCTNCHNRDLNGSDRGPSLHGDRFMANWLNGSVDALYSKIRFSMPATYPETVADDVKLDIVAYLLQVNQFPAGVSELKMDPDALESIQIVKKGSQEVPNFALVQLVGCLAPGPGKSWTLTRTSDPTQTRDETPTPAALRQSATQPLGSQTFLLVSVGAFHPESHAGQKMEARGLLYREASENRLNLTSLQTVAPTCVK
jgi:mono/diheme cytochrome c family protein